MNAVHVNLVVALPAEAKPIVHHFRLQRSLPDRGFPLYQRDHLGLVVSGPGKLAAAAATGWLAGTLSLPATSVWINLGIAGHRYRPRGEAILAHRIIDRASSQQWDIPLCFDAPMERELLVTLDRPTQNYEAQAAMEMEAAGFVTAARRFAPRELVHCLKVISDNAENPPTAINGPRVRQWITGQLGILELLIGQLEKLALSA